MAEKPQNLARWLEAEEPGTDWDAADAHFADVAAAWLPMADAPAGLASRVMAALPLPARESALSRALSGLTASWWARASIAAASVLLGAVAAILVLGPLPGVDTVMAAMGAAGRGAVAAASLAWHAWTAAWPVVASLGQTAATLSATPSAAILVFLNLVLAAGSLAGLSRLLALGKEEV
jgi:hypothetical protein